LLSTKSYLELLTSGDVTFIQKAIMKNDTYSDKCGITAFEAVTAGIKLTLFETVPFFVDHSRKNWHKNCNKYIKIWSPG